MSNIQLPQPQEVLDSMQTVLLSNSSFWQEGKKGGKLTKAMGEEMTNPQDVLNLLAEVLWEGPSNIEKVKSEVGELAFNAWTNNISFMLMKMLKNKEWV